ncbi:MAG: nitronate monooxygenase [Alphaproteobacteria bacterium]|nr:nitronate monooxygenase [Alphaproteobacteria bacterium]
MHPALHTSVCDLLGCDVPIILAGMGGVARADLVAAVTRAGGFGFLGMVRESPELIVSEIEKVRAATERDFGVNLIPAATKPELLEAEVRAVLEAKVPVVALFWDLATALVERLRDEGVLVVCQVGSAVEARAAVAAGAQILIAQGVEAGGHVRGHIARRSVLADVLAVTDVPVLSAGGITNGRELAEALKEGAAGVVMGTAFLATPESFAHDFHKQKIADSAGHTVLTDAFHVNWPKGAMVRVLPNSVTRGEHGDPFSGHRQVIGHEGARRIWLFSTDSPLKDMDGSFEAMALYAGEGVGAITDIVPAAQRITFLIEEAEAQLSGGEQRKISEEAEPASPVCYLQESGDVYAGYAPREEVLALLNTLLEAERAGARITARSALEIREPGLRKLLEEVRKDEARWCAMLLGWIARLEGEASPRTGDFYEKCLAIGDLRERVAFINRGQGWVVKKLRQILPRLRDDALHADLSAMLKSHEENIARAESALSGTG